MQTHTAIGMFQKDISQVVIFYRELLFLGFGRIGNKNKIQMKTDQRALFFLNHVSGLHGEFCFQLRCPNEHVLVPEFYFKKQTWQLMALRGPNGLNPLCVLGQKSKFMKS
jgi:hypothetical protein